MYDLKILRQPRIIKFSRACQMVKRRKTNVSRAISVLVFRVLRVLQYPDDEDGDGSRNLGKL
jgi:hypothetical protein